MFAFCSLNIIMCVAVNLTCTYMQKSVLAHIYSLDYVAVRILIHEWPGVVDRLVVPGSRVQDPPRVASCLLDD